MADSATNPPAPPCERGLPRRRGVWVLGLALFAMFFGSGNLVFPLAVGAEAGPAVYGALAGFLISAVVLPFWGVLAMIAWNGRYDRYFRAFAGPLMPLLVWVLLICWIPMGSGPRCITVAHAAIWPHFGVPLGGFSVVYGALMLIASLRQNWLIPVLGAALTPLLLITLAVVVGVSFVSPGAPAAVAPGLGFWPALMQGYNTQDLVAAFFFSATIVRMVAEEVRAPWGRVGWASALGMALLGLVYGALMLVAHRHSALLAGHGREGLLPHLALSLLGPSWGGLSAVIVALACFTTSIALNTVFAQYLSQRLGWRFSRCAVVTGLVVIAVSNLGFESIAAYSAPAFQVLYPLVLLSLVVTLPATLRRMRGRAAPGGGESLRG